MATVVTAARRRQRAGAGSAGERTELSGGLALALQRTVGTGVLRGLPFIVRVIVRGPGVYLPGLDRTHVARSARRPLEGSLYRVEAWVQGPFEVEAGHGTTIVQRSFRPADGPDVTFILSTSRQAGAIYGAGPGLPFLGSGNALAPRAPGAPDVAGGAGVLRAQVDRRGDDARLIYSGRGGERGLIDGGTRRWGPFAFGAATGRRNDHRRVAMTVPAGAGAVSGSPATQIPARTLMLTGRVAGGYGGNVAVPSTRCPQHSAVNTVSSTHSQLLTNGGLLGN